MGSVIARKRANGTVGYTAQIRIKRGSKVVHTEAQTFDRKQAAATWLKKREAALAEPGALDGVKVVDPLFRDVIDRYIAETERSIGRTKAQVLRSVKNHAMAGLNCSEINSAALVAFAQSIGSQPQTVGNYMSHLGAIFAIARPAWGYPLDQQSYKDAVAVTRRLGVTGKSKQRERRPTLGELDRILSHFTDRKVRRPSSNPMPHIIAFAMFSTRRLEEITRIAWADLDEEHSRILVRDMKNPGEKMGNHIWCDLPGPALRIIQAMPRTAPEIFPYGTDAIGAAFTRASKILGIEDLHFHDLRHEGVSRLFEMGLTIPHVAAVSGHRSWQSLQRYTHVRQSSDKYAGWKWLDVLSPTNKDPRP